MALREFLPDLVNYLDVENIMPFLISKKLLSLKEMEDLKSHSRDRGERVMELVGIMERKGSRSYAIFKEALRSSVCEDNVDLHLGHVELLSRLPSYPVPRPHISRPGSGLLLEEAPPEKLTECVQETAALGLCDSTEFVTSRDSGMPSGNFCNPTQHPFGRSFDSHTSTVSEQDLVGFPHGDAGVELCSELSRWQRRLLAETHRQKRVEDLAREILLENRSLKEANGRLLREKTEMEHCMLFCMPAMRGHEVRVASLARSFSRVGNALANESEFPYFYIISLFVYECSKHVGKRGRSLHCYLTNSSPLSY